MQWFIWKSLLFPVCEWLCMIRLPEWHQTALEKWNKQPHVGVSTSVRPASFGTPLVIHKIKDGVNTGLHIYKGVSWCIWIYKLRIISMYSNYKKIATQQFRSYEINYNKPEVYNDGMLLSELEFMVLKRNMGQQGETPVSLQQHWTCL